MLCQKYLFSFFLEPTSKSKGKFGEEIRQRLSENVTEMVRIVLTKTNQPYFWSMVSTLTVTMATKYKHLSFIKFQEFLILYFTLRESCYSTLKDIL